MPTAPRSPHRPDLGRWAKPTLAGDLVMLRPIVAGDADAMWEALQDAEARDLTATSAVFERPFVDDWCATRADQDERLDLAVVENATGEMAGEAVLNDYDATSDTANFRIGLRGPGWYGRGLGGEATRLMVAHALAPRQQGGVGLSLVTLSVLARNQRARRAYARAGFVTAGEYDEDGEHWVTMEIRR
jgi:RimJ/RimL family protein N-acetyltransferase